VFSLDIASVCLVLCAYLKPKRTDSRKPAVITNSRWFAYATAGAASAFTCANSAEATIHYSGIIGEFFGSGRDKSARFQLDQPRDSIRLRHSLEFEGTFSYGGTVHFGILGLAVAGFAGFYCPSLPQFASVSKLNRGQFISTRPFLTRESGVLAVPHFSDCVGQFDSGDLGFIGFRFNNGSGDQYGWVRIKMGTYYPIDNDFWLVDYAYADPGEPIRAGQTSNNDMVPEESDDVVPQEGSLGALALGAAGLLALRKRRSWNAR
jgi:hypothetical protein